jgi:hypothetical protein
MKIPLATWLCCAGTGLLLAGCITHEETVYKDVERTPVEFENDTAARIFYEKLSHTPHKPSGTESRTEVELPLIFKDKRKVVSGSNGAFNHAVALCDTNRDGRITEKEARIFAALP